MGVGITGDPNTYNAGLDFDYSVWTPGTRVDLVNVNWDNNYRDVVKFFNKKALNNFIDSKISAGVTIKQMTYAKPNNDIYLQIPYNSVNRYNYLRASNPLMPVTGDIQKDFYYFILDAEYIAPQTTRLRLQLDIWQTYVYDVTIGRCYVERGHAGVANNKRNTNFGRDYLTVPEGLDLGGEYVEVAGVNVQSITTSNADVLAISATDLEDTGDDVVTAPGSLYNGLASGASAYVWRTQVDFIQWMNANKDRPWVTQGIMSITLVPSMTRYNPGFTYDSSADNLPSSVPAGPPSDVEHNLWNDWRIAIKELLPERYRHLDKLLTYPYLVVEFTTFSGSPIILKPESWKNADAKIIEMASLVPPNQRIGYFPRDYNVTDASDAYIWDGDTLAMGVYISNFPTMPIVNDGAISYLASNANSLAWQKSNAEWTQNRALGMAQGTYDVATGAMNTMAALTDIGVSTDIAQTGINNRNTQQQGIVNTANAAISGIAQGITPSGLGGAAVAGISNAAATGLNTMYQMQANDDMLATRNSQAGQQLAANTGQSALVRDTNKSLSDWAARGDYANAIAGVDAKVQDAALIQPSSSGQFGGEAFNLVNQINNFRAKWKFIGNDAIARVGEYMLRYGYSINRFMQPPQSLNVMSKFTYWKMSETYLSASNVPEGHKQGLRGILEKGVTVWKDPNEIGVIDYAENEIVGGFYY